MKNPVDHLYIVVFLKNTTAVFYHIPLIICFRILRTMQKMKENVNKYLIT